MVGTHFISLKKKEIKTNPKQRTNPQKSNQPNSPKISAAQGSHKSPNRSLVVKNTMLELHLHDLVHLVPPASSQKGRDHIIIPPVVRGDFMTNPNNVQLFGKSIKITIHLHTFDPPKMVNLMTPAVVVHDFHGWFNWNGFLKQGDFCNKSESFIYKTSIYTPTDLLKFLLDFDSYQHLICFLSFFMSLPKDPKRS